MAVTNSDMSKHLSNALRFAQLNGLTLSETLLLRISLQLEIANNNIIDMQRTLEQMQETLHSIDENVNSIYIFK